MSFTCDFEIDTFDADRFSAQMKSALREGMRDVTITLLRLAIQLAPKDTGYLRSSGSYDVFNVGDSFQSWIHFSAIYAAIQHENEYFHHEIGQAKFLQTVLDANVGVVPTVIAGYLERELQRMSV